MTVELAATGSDMGRLSMFSKIAKRIIPIVMLIVAGLIFLGQWNIKKANRLIDEANKAVDEANKKTAEAAEKQKQLLSESNMAGFPGNRDQLKDVARQTADAFEQSAERYRTAAARFEEAATQPVDGVVVEYWTLKSKSTRKLADAKDDYQKMALLFLDPRHDTADKLTAELESLLKTATQHNEESDDFEAQAVKLQKDHPDKIQ